MSIYLTLQNTEGGELHTLILSVFEFWTHWKTFSILTAVDQSTNMNYFSSCWCHTYFSVSKGLSGYKGQGAYVCAVLPSPIWQMAEQTVGGSIKLHQLNLQGLHYIPMREKSSWCSVFLHNIHATETQVWYPPKLTCQSNYYCRELKVKQIYLYVPPFKKHGHQVINHFWSLFKKYDEILQ